jgi:hypothetical protein
MGFKGYVPCSFHVTQLEVACAFSFMDFKIKFTSLHFRVIRGFEALKEPP